MSAQEGFTGPSSKPYDPLSQRRIDLSDLLFDRMPMGIALLDRELHIRRYNSTWGDFAERYAPSTGKPLQPGTGYFEHLPGAEPVVMPLFERALAGEVVQENEVRLVSGRVTTYWDIVLAPLVENNKTVGILNVAVDVTEQVQLRQNLERRVEERTRELQVLLDVASAANSSLDLGEMLERSVDLIVALVGASRCGVVLLDEDTDQLVPTTLRPERDVSANDLSGILSACRTVIDSGESLYVAPDPGQGLHEPGALIPLKSRGGRLGVLVIVGPEGSTFPDAQMTLFQSIADQLSVALENARLVERNEQAVVTAERNRLARDLHDAVTQTLFSSSMIADVLPKIWERDPEEGYRRLEELRQLTRGALSEMRTLLVELRPAALADTDLGDLIGHQVNAFIARTRLTVGYERHCVQNPPVEIKETFYRVAQEAFNNIAKHAEAAHVRVTLNCLPVSAELVIEDDGIGFDPGLLDHEGLGLGIMRERAQVVGASLGIRSRPEAGCRLQIIWQAPDQEKTND